LHLQHDRLDIYEVLAIAGWAFVIVLMIVAMGAGRELHGAGDVLPSLPGVRSFLRSVIVDRGASGRDSSLLFVSDRPRDRDWFGQLSHDLCNLLCRGRFLTSGP